MGLITVFLSIIYISFIISAVSGLLQSNHKYQIEKIDYYNIMKFISAVICVILSIAYAETTGSSQVANQTLDASTQNKVYLHLNLSQEFVITQLNQTTTFHIVTAQSMNITVQLIQLVGSVLMKISDSFQNRIVCRNPSMSNNRIVCSFTTNAAAIYMVNLEANKEGAHKFIILYHKEADCIPYSLNMPLYLELDYGETDCSIFNITNLANIQIATSVPLPLMISDSLSFQVCIASYCQQIITSVHHYTLTKNKLSQYCTLVNNTDQQFSCEIQLKYSVKNDSFAHFSLIVEEQGMDINLFDGIAEKVTSYDLSQTNGKYFYYQIYDYSTVKIILTSFADNILYYAAHFVEETQFFQNTSQIYLSNQFEIHNPSGNSTPNYFQSTVIGPAVDIVTIPSKVIDYYCDNCLLTIAVYQNKSINTTDNAFFSSFQIEVTQRQTILFPGNSKKGSLEQGDVYNYQLGGAQGNSLINIHDLNKESSSQSDCFSVRLTDYLDQESIVVGSGYTSIGYDSNLTNVYVTGREDYCQYEISYVQVDNPILTININQKYPLLLDGNSEAYFLYFHVSNHSFGIVELIQSGKSSLVLATSIVNETIQSLLAGNHSNFPFTNSDGLENLIIHNTSPQFCSNCNYLIVVKSDSPVKGELLISDLNSYVPLSLNSILKDKLGQILEQSKKKYSFTSVTAFNVSINLLYGQISVMIQDNNFQLIDKVVITQSTVIKIPRNGSQSNDGSSLQRCYYITIQGHNSLYTIKARKISISHHRIFQGIPSQILLQREKPTILEFLNLDSFNAKTNIANNINVLLDITSLISQQKNLQLKTSVQIQTENGVQPVFINSLTQSDKTFNIQLPQRLGTYYITVTSIFTLNVSVILAKQQLIHLKQSARAIMSKQANFQLYSDKPTLMVEVFACWGDLGVEASNKYIDFSEDGHQQSLLQFDHSNYGGHYVISTTKGYGQYFIRVFNRRKDEPELAYLITYSYFSSINGMPYKLIYPTTLQISYTVTPNFLIFSFDQVRVRQSKSVNFEIEVEYRLYLSTNKYRLKKFANCRVGDVAVLTDDSAVIQGNSVIFQIEISNLDSLIGQSGVYFVGAEAVVTIVSAGMKEKISYAENRSADALRIIYEAIQMTNSVFKINESQSLLPIVKVLFLWILIPFAIVCLLLYLSLKYCLINYRQLEFVDLIQEEGSEEKGKRTITQKESGKPLHESIPLPLSDCSPIHI